MKKKLKKITKDEALKEELNPGFYESHGSIEYRRKLQSLITKKDYMNPTFWKKMLKERFFSNVAIIVNMELSTGNHHSFLQVIDSDRSFKFNKKTYIYDPEFRYYNNDLKFYCIDYHENIALPIKRNIPSHSIEKQFHIDNIEVEYSLNPLVLHNFINSKIAEGIMKGQEISEYLRKYGILIMIILVTVIAHFLLWGYRTGMFDKIMNSVGL